MKKYIELQVQSIKISLPIVLMFYSSKLFFQIAIRCEYMVKSFIEFVPGIFQGWTVLECT